MVLALTNGAPAFIIDFALIMMGCSQAGKAQDFDSCISLVRVQPSQPLRAISSVGRALDF